MDSLLSLMSLALREARLFLLLTLPAIGLCGCAGRESTLPRLCGQPSAQTRAPDLSGDGLHECRRGDALPGGRSLGTSRVCPRQVDQAPSGAAEFGLGGGVVDCALLRSKLESLQSQAAATRGQWRETRSLHRDAHLEWSELGATLLSKQNAVVRVHRRLLELQRVYSLNPLPALVETLADVTAEQESLRRDVSELSSCADAAEQRERASRAKLLMVAAHTPGPVG